ncbi:putative metalloprotease CJM1_0395 family protein [Neptunomonas antarctica]|uniref:SprA-related family protein n=1 Tax=Neptunomonas antarctica TaxID=619304 RepID=A0A1N7JG22_9GAMM|nr:putative metalloprotease CJM1_0395 family protein [Neptunomonas antarctica]SIS48201.1 SprA-related family protein [Neptunomonas antarctica]
MIINNYSSSMIRSASHDSSAAVKSISSNQSSSTTSSSNTQIQSASSDPLQGQDKFSKQGAEISQTTVSASEASTNQSSDKRVEEANRQIAQDLSRRDLEVKNHERIHASIGGAFASAPNFDYERGPDGQLYAVGGDVRIDTSPVSDDPRATLEKAQVIIRAALSVPEPSTQDRRVAAQARVMATEAQAEIAKLEAPVQISDQDTRSEKSDSQEIDSQKAALANEAAALEDEKNKLRSEETKDKQSEDQKTLAERNEEQNASGRAVASLQEFNNRLNDLNKKLSDINLRLVDAGVFQKLFPEGSIIDKNI